MNRIILTIRKKNGDHANTIFACELSDPYDPSCVRRTLELGLMDCCMHKADVLTWLDLFKGARSGRFVSDGKTSLCVETVELKDPFAKNIRKLREKFSAFEIKLVNADDDTDVDRWADKALEEALDRAWRADDDKGIGK